MLILTLLFVVSCTQNGQIIEPPKEESDVVIPPCSYYLKVGSYDGDAEDIAKKMAYDVLNERDSRIKLEHLEVDATPYMNFKTNPPSPAEGEIVYHMLDGEGVEMVESSEVVMVRVSPDFYVEFNVTSCATYNDGSKHLGCTSNLHFANGEIFIQFGNPC